MINFKAKNQKEADLYIYGDIGESFWTETVTAKQFVKDLKELGDVSQLNIFINSGGGNVFDGMAIYSALKRHNANKTVYIDGLAASIASVIAMAGDKILMPKNGLMMIHKASAGQYGNATEFRKLADTLDVVDGTISETYESKTEKTKDEILNLMDVETWMSADKALEDGFINEIENEKKVAASLDPEFLNFGNQKFKVKGFKNFNVTVETYRESLPTVPVVPINDPKNGTDTEIFAQDQEFRKLKEKLLNI